MFDVIKLILFGKSIIVLKVLISVYIGGIIKCSLSEQDKRKLREAIINLF